MTSKSELENPFIEKLNISKDDAKNYSKYTMFLKTGQASSIRTLSEALKEVLTDINIYFDNTGLKISSVDSHKIAFAHLSLNSEKFLEYYCPNEITIGVNTQSLYKLLKTISNSDIVTLYIEKDNINNLGIQLEDQEKKVMSDTKLRLLDLDEDSIKIPPITYESVYNMPCVDFQKYCRDLAIISNKVEITTKGNVFTMSASGDFAEREVTIGNIGDDIGESGTETETDVKEVKIGTYMLRYLNLFCKSSSLCTTLEIYINPGYPLILVYAVGSLGFLRLGLAPGFYNN